VRIVLDTNVVMSALLWRGTPYRLLDTIRQNTRLQLYSSPALLEELTDVLTRPAATKRLSSLGKTAREVLADYLEAIELVEPAEIAPVVIHDPDDDHVLACALAANADMIVSGDADLLTLKAHQNIPIRTPAEALHVLGSAP
jgi:putative PIN family toxin of toxin-antitoxin system